VRAIASIFLATLFAAGCTATATPMTPSSMPSPTAQPTSSPTPAPTTGTPGEPASILEVSCGPAATILGSDAVRTSPDGIHLRVTGQPGWSLGIDHEFGHEAVVLDSPSQDLVLRIAPGNVTVDCGDPTLANLPPSSALRIEDPDGLYRSLAIGTGAGSCVSDSDDAGGAKGKAGDPVLQARMGLRGLRAGDVVERAGYPVDKGSVRVVRAGEVIGVLTYDADGHGGWLPMGSTLCGGLSAG